MNADGSTTTETDTPYYSGTSDSQVTAYNIISYHLFHENPQGNAAIHGHSMITAALCNLMSLAGLGHLQEKTCLQGRRLASTYESSGDWGSSTTTVREPYSGSLFAQRLGEETHVLHDACAMPDVA